MSLYMSTDQASDHHHHSHHQHYGQQHHSQRHGGGSSIDPHSIQLMRFSAANDRKAKRRAQNRESQKAFRKRKAEQEEQMQVEFKDLQTRCADLTEENAGLRELLESFRDEGNQRNRTELHVKRVSRTLDQGPSTDADGPPHTRQRTSARHGNRSDAKDVERRNSAESLSGLSSSSVKSRSSSSGSDHSAVGDWASSSSVATSASTPKDISLPTDYTNPSFFKDLNDSSRQIMPGNQLGLTDAAGPVDLNSSHISMPAGGRPSGLTPHAMWSDSPFAFEWPGQATASFETFSVLQDFQGKGPCATPAVENSVPFNGLQSLTDFLGSNLPSLANTQATGASTSGLAGEISTEVDQQPDTRTQHLLDGDSTVAGRRGIIVPRLPMATLV